VHAPYRRVREATHAVTRQPDSRLVRNKRRFDTFQTQDTQRDMTAMTAQSATDIREHLVLLETERALAIEAGLRDDPAYMADLREEIVATRAAYVGSAVVEIASLRAALSGPQVG
jgi:hypothetical protein